MARGGSNCLGWWVLRRCVLSRWFLNLYVCGVVCTTVAERGWGGGISLHTTIANCLYMQKRKTDDIWSFKVNLIYLM